MTGPAAPAPLDPWVIVGNGYYGNGIWMVQRPDESSDDAAMLPLRTEAEAVAVRDALNRVARGGAGSPEPSEIEINTGAEYLFSHDRQQDEPIWQDGPPATREAYRAYARGFLTAIRERAQYDRAVQAEREPEAKRCPTCGDWPMRCRCHATGDEASPDLWCAACGTLRVSRYICPKCVGQAEHLRAPTPFAGEFPEMSDAELTLRKLLWLRHGCTGIYGDDGELQCAKCMIDFRRMAPREIERRWFEIGVAKVAAEQRALQGAPNEETKP